MSTIIDTWEFRGWLRKLKDAQAKASILRRIERARRGHFGDHKSVGGGVYEMRIPAGPGYRLYYCRVDDAIHLLLLGGDKATQTRDIEKAKWMAATLRD